MADPRTFTLIGEFKDGITPELEKINKQLATLKTSFAGVGSRKNTGFRGATKEIGKLVSAHKNLADSVKQVKTELQSTVSVLRQYRSEMGKAAAANRAFQKSGGNLGSSAFAKNMRAANQEAQAYLRTLKQINAQSGKAPRMPRMPRAAAGGGGGGGGGGRTPGRGGGGGAGGGGMNAHMGEFGFAYTLGSSISQPIQNAIARGFQIGVGFMTKPFEYFAKNLQERIEDEQSDIKAAGGIFSIARRQKDPFVKTMDEAMEFTQANNKAMAELADALPGNTQQYIEVSKRISDSISRIVMADPTKAIEYSNKLRAEEGQGALTGGTRGQTKGAITQLLGEMTKKTVLAGLGGGGGGPGGIAGAYGLPQLTERMLTQDEVSMGQFQRYAAIFKDPLIMDALNRFIPQINQSAAGTLDRFKVMQKFYDDVLPKEMIRKFERSSAGVLELFNTSIFGPETGLLGLGRKMKGMGKVMDDYGNYVKVFEDGTREVVYSMKDASDANLSLFDMLRDSFANLGIALFPILQNLSAIFDPINKISKLLIDFRHQTGEFLNAFESYKKGLEGMVKKMSELDKNEFLKISVDLRASLAAVNNFFANQGIIDESQFQKNAKQIMSKTFDYKGMIGGMLDTFLNSDTAGKLGELIGSIVGTVLAQVAQVTGFVSGRISSSSKLVSGLKKGFDAAKGTEAFKNIFKDVFTAMFNVLKEILRILPIEALMMLGLAALAPAVVQGLAMSLASRLFGGVKNMLGVVGESMLGVFKKQGKKFKDIEKASVTDLGTVITDPRRMLPGTATAPLPTTGPGAAGGAGVWASITGALKGLVPLLSKLSLILAAVVIVGGGLDSTLRQLGEALSESGANIGGAFGGLFDSLGVLTGFVGDLGRRIGELLGPLFGAKNGFDGLKIVLGIITLPLQLISQGLRGLAVALANFRLMLARLTNDPETKKIEAERNALDAKLASDRGQINAYNASMLGPKELKDQANNAAYELANSKTIGRIRREELTAFIAAAQNKPAPGAPATPAAPGAPATPAPAGPVSIPAASAPALGSIATSTAATATATGQINQKATAQINKIGQTNATLTTIQSVMGTLGGKLDGFKAAIATQTSVIRSGNMAILGAISAAASSGGFGGMGGGIFNLPSGDGVKRVVSAGKMLQGMGLNVAENPYFGTGRVGGHAPGSYHYAGRAIDVTGPPATLDAAYAKLKGTNPAELLWRTAGHYDHLHVAYANGFPGNGTAFGTLEGAEKFERAMMPGSVKVASITANSREGFGGGSTFNNTITIQQQPGQDSEQLAAIVVAKMGEWVSDARSSSIFV